MHIFVGNQWIYAWYMVSPFWSFYIFKNEVHIIHNYSLAYYIYRCLKFFNMPTQTTSLRTNRATFWISTFLLMPWHGTNCSNTLVLDRNECSSSRAPLGCHIYSYNTRINSNRADVTKVHLVLTLATFKSLTGLNIVRAWSLTLIKRRVELVINAFSRELFIA